MSSNFYKLGWRLQNWKISTATATDTQPTQIKIELGHAYAPSQLLNRYVPQKIKSKFDLHNPPGKQKQLTYSLHL